MTTSLGAAPAALTDLDYALLELICRLRVVTQTQLERVHSDVPARTLRYRTRRLCAGGLLGRSRPYRERGSAPHHLWPTRRGDAFVRGAPAPRRGEREAPSPLFLAHSAAISELYVSLRTGDAELVEFAREGEARRPFTDEGGRARAIAPDVRIGLRAAHGGDAVSANVEMDLGTMSHARLRTKLDGYLAHAHTGEALPLLLLTTHGSRARTFVNTARGALAGRRAVDPDAPGLAIAVCDQARHLDRAVAAPCWTAVGGESTEPRRLLALLTDA